MEKNLDLSFYMCIQEDWNQSRVLKEPWVLNRVAPFPRRNQSRIFSECGISLKIPAVLISRICGWPQCAQCEIQGERCGKRKEKEREEADSSNMSTGMVFHRGASAWYAPGLLRRRSVIHNAVRPLTKGSWWDGSLQDRIIWVVICRRRCWFFGWLCCRVRVRPPAVTDPPGTSRARRAPLSPRLLPRLSSLPRRTDSIFYFVVFRRRAGLAFPPIVSGYFSLVTFHIQSPLAYLKTRDGSVMGEKGKDNARI